MVFVLINKRNWKQPGPIVNVGVHNAYSLAVLGYETHFCVGAGEPSDTMSDLKTFYGLNPWPTFTIHRVERRQFGHFTSSLSIFGYAYRLIQKLRRKDEVTVITREGSSNLPAPSKPSISYLMAFPLSRATFQRPATFSAIAQSIFLLGIVLPCEMP